MHCPKCKSEDTVKVSVLFKSSTRSVSGKNVSVMSTLIQSLSPPKEPSAKYIGCLGAIIILGVILVANSILLAFVSQGSWAHNIIGTFLCLVLIILGIKIIRRRINASKEIKMPAYKKSLENWNKSWYCKKCGNVYIVEENSKDIDVSE